MSFYSYKNLFNIRWKIYSIGDKPLPRPIPLSGLFLYAVLFFPSYFIAYIVAGFFNQPIVLTTFIFDGILTYFALSYDPQGRSFFIFLTDIFVYLVSPKVKDLNGKTIPAQRKLKLYWDTLDLDG